MDCSQPIEVMIHNIEQVHRFLLQNPEEALILLHHKLGEGCPALSIVNIAEVPLFQGLLVHVSRFGKLDDGVSNEVDMR